MPQNDKDLLLRLQQQGVELGRTAHHTMQRIITITVVAMATAAAAAAVWFWALRPLGFASYLTSTGASDTDIIRQYWPHRLVEPEWVSAIPDRLMNWHLAEMGARLSVVASLWLLTAGGAVYRFVRRGSVRPNTALPSNSPTNNGRTNFIGSQQVQFQAEPWLSS